VGEMKRHVTGAESCVPPNWPVPYKVDVIVWRGVRVPLIEYDNGIEVMDAIISASILSVSKSALALT